MQNVALNGKLLLAPHFTFTTCISMAIEKECKNEKKNTIRPATKEDKKEATWYE